MVDNNNNNNNNNNTELDLEDFNVNYLSSLALKILFSLIMQSCV